MAATTRERLAWSGGDAVGSGVRRVRGVRSGMLVFRFGEGICQLLHRSEIFHVAIAKVLKTHIGKR